MERPDAVGPWHCSTIWSHDFCQVIVSLHPQSEWFGVMVSRVLFALRFYNSKFHLILPQGITT